ncbi:MAG: 3-dehydroquinate synthase [Clostridiales bacterium]|nr:3-dehydroquinate synthase [Clostridiales bacterium]
MPQLMVDVGHTKYPLHIEQDGIYKVGNYVKKQFPTSCAVIITDSNVQALYAKQVEDSLDNSSIKHHTIVLSPGEPTKSFEVLIDVYNKLIALGIQKTDVIIALGGGVIGDLAGFAASSYLRGVNFIQIPTTLLAQIDSAIGGKVAVNLDTGKNLVGAFYHPKFVIIDTQVLKTLSDDDFAGGMAEVIKTGAIYDVALLNTIESHAGRSHIMKVIDDVVHRCCAIKAEVVKQDELDNGLRMILNFGHTLAHAIEKLPDNTFTHGQAVAIGMVQFAKLGEQMNITSIGTSNTLQKIVQSFGLPYEIVADKDKLIDIMKRDKKIRDGKLNLILLRKLGEACVNPIPISQIGELL